MGDVGYDVIEMVDDVVVCEAEDVPSEVMKLAVPGSIQPRSVLMILPVNFDDETDLGGSEINDVVSDDELSAERESGRVQIFSGGVKSGDCRSFGELTRRA